MLAAITLRDSILALHIAAVVVAFGVTFAYPVIFSVAARVDPRSMPVIYRITHTLSRRLIQPGLLVILAAGVYLASDEHSWKAFFVQWGIGAVIVLGALEGAVLAPTERKLIDIGEREVAAGAEATPSAEHLALARRLQTVGTLAALIVLATIFFMANHVGGCAG